MNLEISLEEAQKILNYLAKQPYHEVLEIITILQKRAQEAQAKTKKE